MAGTLREKAGVVGRAKDRHSVGNLHERDEKLERVTYWACERDRL